MLPITCHTALTSIPESAEKHEALPSDFDQCVADVARWLVLGATLTTPSHSVGRHHLATEGDGMRFACLDRAGSVVRVDEEECRATSMFSTETTLRHDWTAFGAALAFVFAVGRRAAREAMAKLCSAVAPISVRRSGLFRRRVAVAHWMTERVLLGGAGLTLRRSR